MSGDNVDSTSVILLKCTGCGKAYKVHPEKLPRGVTSFPCRACGSLIPIDGINQGADPSGKQQVVIIVVEEKDLAQLIERILVRHGYRGLSVHSGREAVELIHRGHVDLVLISVFLPDMMGYEILDAINEGRKDGSRVPSILLSSVHHAARYKRAPTSLYGADDYLERHHLPDLLIPKIQRLLDSDGSGKPAVDPGMLPPPADEQVRERREIEDLEMREETGGDPVLEDIRRLCRVIAGDIALYNEDVIRATTPGRILEVIVQDLNEGEALLDRKFPGKGELTSQLLRKEMANLLKSRGITDP
ncbi:MAG: response regulator [bacterium]|nr:response regulator [bacterium]